MSPRTSRLPFRRAVPSGCLAFILALVGSASGPAQEATPTAPPPPSRPSSPKVVRRVMPEHPAELKKKLVNGDALLECTVNPDGKVADVKVVRESHPGFGAAAEEALRQWEFEPGPSDGKRVRVPFEFRLSAEQVLETLAGRPIFMEVAETVIPAAQLPAWPRPLQYYVPRYPQELEGSGKYGKAVVNITIDKEGKVINPRIVKTTYPEFALPALITAMRLQFPPQVMANNAKIYVNMDLQFDFKVPTKDAK